MFWNPQTPQLTHKGSVLVRLRFPISTLVFIAAMASAAMAQPAGTLIEITDAWARLPTAEGGPAILNVQ
jgi:hypothetical protein